MLIDFKLKNFLSYKDLQTFSMVKGNTVRKNERVEDFKKISLLKFGAIYGANAAGKSNLVKALNYMKYIILNGPNKDKPSFNYRFDHKMENEPTYFEVTLMLDGDTLAYGFEYLSNEHKFTSEWVWNVDDEKYVFNRDVINNTLTTDYTNKNDEFLKTLDMFRWLEDNELLLRRVAISSKISETTYSDMIKRIFIWFLYYLRITTPNRILTSGNYFMDGNKMHILGELLKSFDTGIEEIKTIEYSAESAFNDLPKHIISSAKERWLNSSKSKKISMLYRTEDDLWKVTVKNVIDDENVEFKYERLCFYHTGSKFPLTLKNESDGTIRLLDLAEILVSDEEDITYIVDELDRCLHPQLTCKFIDEFLKLSEKKKIQLVVTTHESRLLDFEILRRDEIWFTEKKNNISTLYSLEEFNVRFDKKIDKAYLNGRFGGVPVFDTIFPTFK